MSTRITGLLTPHMVALDGQGRIHESELRRHGDWLIATIPRQRPDFSFLTGWDAVLAPRLLVGADGGTNATSGVVPELTRTASTTSNPKPRQPPAEPPRQVQYVRKHSLPS